MTEKDTTVILRVQLDPSQEIKKMEALTLELETNRKAQQELNASRKAQTITDAEYSKRQVELKGTISALQKEYNAAGKNLTAYQNLTEQAEGSVDQLKAQLALLSTQYNSLSKAERENSEAGKELQAQTKSVSEALSEIGAGVNDFRRNVGNYAGSLKGSFEELVQQLVKLEAQEKKLVAGSKELMQNQQQQIGFRTAAVQAAAKEGESYENVTNKLQNYSAAIRPAVEALTQLEAEQARVVAAGEQTSEAYQKIGFQIAQTKKQIADTPLEIPPVEVPEIKVPTDSLEELAVALVKLREEQQGLAEDSEAFQELERKATAYGVAATAAGAKAGLSFDQSKQKLTAYSKQVQPLISELVKLEKEQQAVGDTGSEAYAKLAFQIEQTKKKISEVPAVTKPVTDRLTELDSVTNVFGGRISNLKEAFTAAKTGTDIATKGLSGVRIAMLAIPLVAIVAGLAALYAWFTRTQEGLDFVERKTKGFSVALGVLTDKVSAVGEVLFKAFSNPKQAASDLVDFIGTNLLNRLKSFGVVVRGILDLDPRKITDGFIQFGTGIEGATGKAAALTKELLAAAKAGEAIAAENQRIRDTERQINVERAQSKKDIEALKLIAEDQTKSTQERVKATQQAAALEQRSINGQLKAQRDRIVNMEREAKLTNQLTENNDALAEQRIKLAELEEGSLTRQIELNNKLNELRKEAFEKANADQKAYYERLVLEAEKGSQAELNARIKLIEADSAAQLAAVGLTENQRKLIVAKAESDIRQLRLAFRQTTLQQAAELERIALDTRLRQVAEGSDEELSILQRQLKIERDLQLSAANLTVAQRKAINAKYDSDSDKLLEDTIRKRAQIALNVEAQAIAVRLNAVKQGSAEELKLQQQAVEKQRQVQIAAISERANADERAAQERLINSNAERQQNELLYADRIKAVQTFYQQERNTLEEARAGGLITEKEYAELLFQQELGQVAARREVNKRFNKDTAADDQQLTDLRIANLKRVTDEERQQAQQRADITRDLAVLVGQFFAESVNDAGQALEDFARKALLILVQSVEKSIIAAQVKILVDAFSSKESLATFGAAGFLKAGLIIAAVTAAVAPLKQALSSTSSTQFAKGTVLGGASHANGGTQLYGRNGYWYGEAEAGEAVINRRSTELYLPLLSKINELGGGKPLVRAGVSMGTLPQVPHYALGGVNNAYIREGLASSQSSLSANDIGAAVVQELRKGAIKAEISDIKSAFRREDFTDSIANAK